MNRLRVDLVDSTVSVAIWGVEQGLPQPSITELALDSDGYVWGSTFGGLARLDGRNVKGYSAADLTVLVNNSVTAIHFGRDSLLYIGTPLGTIARLRQGRFLDTLPADDRPQLHGVDAIAMDQSGRLFVRSQTTVYRYVNRQWSARPIPYPAYSMLANDSTGAVLYAGPAGVVRASASGDSIIAQGIPVLPDDDYDYALHVDRRGRIWVGRPDGLSLVDNGELKPVPGITGRVHAIASDSDGIIWVGADQNLYRFKADELASSRGGARLILRANSDIRSLLHTPDDVLLIGTIQGLITLRESLVSILANPVGGYFMESTSMIPDGRGNVWMTGSCTDLFLLARHGKPLDSIARPRADGCIRSAIRDSSGNIWVGGDGVVRRRDVRGVIRDWGLPSFGDNLNFARPALAIGDTVLFGLSDGRIVAISQDDSLAIVKPWSRISNNPIESFALDGDGNIWVGQTGVVTRWRGNETKSWAAESGVPAAVPRAIFVEPGRGVWLGTYGRGLWFLSLDGKASAVPLVDETVSAILPDNSGRIWMPGNRGISIVLRDDLLKWLKDSSDVPDVRLLSEADGVPEGNSGYPAAARISSDLLAFASVDGLVAVSASSIQSRTTPASAYIDELHTFRGPVSLSNGAVRLSPAERSLTITYSSPTFRFADEVQFRYKLVGRDDRWVSLGRNRELRLTLEKPGRYRFLVESRIPGSTWQSAPPLEIEAAPEFFERASVRLILVALGVVLVAVVYRQRINGLNAVARANEAILRAQRASAEDAARHERLLAQAGRLGVAGELTASLSHELGQPLAAMVNNAEVARRMIARSVTGNPLNRDTIDAVLQDVVDQGRRASGIVREFRRFLKQETGERETVSAHALLQSAATLLGREYREAGVKLLVRVEPDTPHVSVELVLLQQVLVNLLQNALEAARQARDGQVMMRARGASDGVRITVADNGNGFSKEMRGRAFEPFVTSRADGMGLGLAIAKRVVEAHGGHIGVGRMPASNVRNPSDLPCGAVISFWLPITTDRTDGSKSEHSSSS